MKKKLFLSLVFKFFFLKTGKFEHARIKEIYLRNNNEEKKERNFKFNK